MYIGPSLLQPFIDNRPVHTCMTYAQYIWSTYMNPKLDAMIARREDQNAAWLAQRQHQLGKPMKVIKVERVNMPPILRIEG